MRYRLYLLFRRMLCGRGIHDYEFVTQTEDGWGILECFYCMRVKQSKRA